MLGMSTILTDLMAVALVLMTWETLTGVGIQVFRFGIERRYHMSNWELKMAPERKNRNPVNGRFVKGCTPYNKGKKWDEYMSKREQKKRLEHLHRFNGRCPGSGRPKISVVAVNDHGRYLFFDSIIEASQWVGVRHENVRQCCCMNRDRKLLRTTSGKLTNKVNTDHKLKGIRFYFKSDPTWMEKIKK